MIAYILDTSFIRAAPTELIARARSEGLRLLVSPISVWELLSHFEDGTTAFGRCKGWMRKLGYCEMLEHPEAEVREAIGVAAHIPDYARIAWREREAALAIVDIISRATSPQDVYVSTFCDSLGNLHTLEDCGRLVRQVLADLEHRHAAVVRPVLEAMNAEFARLGRSHRDDAALSDREFFEHVTREVRRVAATADTPTIRCAEERIFEYAFARIGHVIESVLRLVRDGGKLDVNDYEDALICNHVDLATERILVTEDCDVHDALARSETRLRKYVKELGFKTRLSPLAINRAQFEARLGHDAPPIEPLIST